MQLYAVDKPLGLTSHDVVARARRVLGTRRVGHAGTLDPLATGVLLLMAEEATKLSGYLTGHDKTYLAWVTFGATTPTLDAEGPIVRVADASRLTEDMVSNQFGRFLDMTIQRPPAFSAVKQAGVRSYAAARRGVVEEPPPRAVAYREVALLGLVENPADLPSRFARPPDAAGGRYEPHPDGRRFELPEAPGTSEGVTGTAVTRTALIRLTVGAGTYVRSFARDLGASLGLPAYLSGLVRTASGAVDIGNAVRLEDLPGAGTVEPTVALEMPVIELSATQVADVRHGRRPELAVSVRAALVTERGELVALVDPAPDGAGYRLLRVFN